MITQETELRIASGETEDLLSRYSVAKGPSFREADTAYATQTDPVTLNLYLYANADPIDNTDPTGHFALFSMLGTAAVWAGMAAQMVGDATMALGFASFVVSGAEYLDATLCLAQTDANDINDRLL